MLLKELPLILTLIHVSLIREERIKVRLLLHHSIVIAVLYLHLLELLLHLLELLELLKLLELLELLILFWRHERIFLLLHLRLKEWHLSRSLILKAV